MGAKLIIDRDRIAFIGTDNGATMFSIRIPLNKESSQPCNGNMIALALGSKETVASLYKKAIELGAT